MLYYFQCGKVDHNYYININWYYKIQNVKEKILLNKNLLQNLFDPGIGGFMVRQRNRTAPGRTKQTLGRKDSTGSETLQGKDESKYRSTLSAR